MVCTWLCLEYFYEDDQGATPAKCTVLLHLDHQRSNAIIIIIIIINIVIIILLSWSTSSPSSLSSLTGAHYLEPATSVYYASVFSQVKLFLAKSFLRKLLLPMKSPTTLEGNTEIIAWDAVRTLRKSFFACIHFVNFPDGRGSVSMYQQSTKKSIVRMWLAIQNQLQENCI